MELSHPLRVRGLKQNHIANIAICLQSHPLRVRGLKQTYDMGENAYK